MLKVFNDFERRPDLLAKFDAVAKCYSASCVFADVMYRTGVMDNPWATDALREKIRHGQEYLNSRVLGQPDAVRNAYRDAMGIDR